jgi:hypothetical protein
MEKKKETLAADINAIIENDEKMVRGLIKQVNQKRSYLVNVSATCNKESS